MKKLIKNTGKFMTPVSFISLKGCVLYWGAIFSPIFSIFLWVSYWMALVRVLCLN